MAAKAVVVNGQTVYEVELNGVRGYCNGNPDGYYLFNSSFEAGSTFVRVIANGMKPALYPITLDGNNQEIHFGVDGGPDNTIHLPGLSFEKPSRDRIINVKANFCNLYDAQGLPIFEDFIDTLIVEDEARAEDWITRLRAAGSTHITVTLSGDYPEALGWIDRYPIIGKDWTRDLTGFAQCLDWIISRGFIPIVKLATDGLAYDNAGLTYGWKWGMDKLPNILNDLSRFWDSCLWSTGFDGCFPTWSSKQTIQMLRMLKSVMGDKGNIDTEFAGPGSISYCHMGRGAEDWADDQLGLLDCFSLELEVFPAQAEGISQTATRLLGPNAKNCPTTPYYLANTTKKINICFFETVAYWFIHKVTNDYKTDANLGKFYGFTSFGNGLPDA